MIAAENTIAHIVLMDSQGKLWEREFVSAVVILNVLLQTNRMCVIFVCVCSDSLLILADGKNIWSPVSALSVPWNQGDR